MHEFRSGVKDSGADRSDPRGSGDRAPACDSVARVQGARRRYIGVTGFAEPADVVIARECVGLVPPAWRLMAGVLVSAKTLRGERVERRRYPALAVAAALLSDLRDAGAWPVVHFNTRATGAAFRAELEQLARALPAARGVQLNVVRPDRDALAAFFAARPEQEFILQVNRAVLHDAFDPETAIDAYVEHYDGIARHALVDFSGGEGKPLDAGFALRLIHDWTHRAGLAVAGGLDAHAVRALIGVRVSCDAESRLRTPDDVLDREATLAYVRAAAEMFHYGDRGATP